MPSGAASRYSVGDRIKWTQTTVKYGVIRTVADTLLTIAVNSDYTVANAAISAISYSKQLTPVGYPGWFNFVPTQTGFSADIGSYSCKYAVNGGVCHFYFRSNADGTSNATTFTLTAPFTNAAADPGYQHAWAYTRDNGTVSAGGYVFIAPATAVFTINKTPNSEPFTNSGGKSCNFTIAYSII